MIVCLDGASVNVWSVALLVSGSYRLQCVFILCIYIIYILIFCIKHGWCFTNV